MFFKNLIIFVTVIFVGHESSVVIPPCRHNEFRCGDGGCVPLDEGCGTPYTWINLRKPMTKKINHNVVTQKSCVMPSYPKNGRYDVIVTEPEFTLDGINYGPYVHIEFICDSGYTLVGKPTVECIYSIWRDEFPRCSKVDRGCDINQLPKLSDKCRREPDNSDYGLCSRYLFKYSCWRGDSFRDCEGYVAEGTKVTVVHEMERDIHAPHYTASISCTSDGIFLVNTQCVEELDIMLHEFENLTKRLITNEKKSDSLNTPRAKFEDMEKKFGYFFNDMTLKLEEMRNKIKQCDIQLELLSALQHPEASRACELPPNPENGQYSVEPFNEWWTADHINLALMYKCNPGFVLIGTHPRCVNGVWKDQFPRCSAACKLVKKAKFNYQCDTNANASYDSCQEYVAVGSVVRVSRHQEANAVPITVSIACLEDGTFNITTTCVQELEQQQKDFELPTSTKIVEYEKKIGGMDSNDATFQPLADEFNSFEEHVHSSFQKMNRKADECDIYLDLLLPG